jgi:hypothetical protein
VSVIERSAFIVSVSLLACACGRSHHQLEQARAGAGGASQDTALVAAGSAAPRAGSAGVAGGVSGAVARDAGSAGMVDAAAVERDCRETLRCSQGVGTLDDCVASSSKALNEAPPETQRVFQQLCDACAAFEACAYVACTNAAAAGPGGSGG